MLKHGHNLPLILKAAAGDTAGLLAGETWATFNSSELSESIWVFTFIWPPLLFNRPELLFSSLFRFGAFSFDSLCFFEVDESLSLSSSLLDCWSLFTRFIVRQLMHFETYSIGNEKRTVTEQYESLSLGESFWKKYIWNYLLEITSTCDIFTSSITTEDSYLFWV